MQNEENRISRECEKHELSNAEKYPNLIPFTGEQSREKARENGRKGGIASGVAKREKKSIKELCAELLVQEAPEEFIKQAFPDGSPEDKSWYALIVAQQARQAAAGNTKAAVFIRDSAGDMPTTKVQADIGMTDGDRALLHKIESRLKETGPKSGE